MIEAETRTLHPPYVPWLQLNFIYISTIPYITWENGLYKYSLIFYIYIRQGGDNWGPKIPSSPCHESRSKGVEPAPLGIGQGWHMLFFHP